MKFLWRYALVVAALIAASLLLAACGGEEEEEAAAPTTATAAATEEVAPTKTPIEGEEEALPPTPTPALGTPAGGLDPEDFAEFADLVARAVEEQDTAFFADRVEGKTYTCTEMDVPGEGWGIEQGICQEVGQEVEVVENRFWRSEGLLVRPEAIGEQMGKYFSNALPEEDDEYGAGAVRLYAIGTSRPSDAAPARTYKVAILTAITPLGEDPASEPVRTVRGILFQHAEGRWVIRGMDFATVLAEELLSPETAPFADWQRY